MADFTLNTSTLAGAVFKTVPQETVGQFREIDFGFSQGTSAGDMEIHWWEFHFEFGAESSEDV